MLSERGMQGALSATNSMTILLVRECWTAAAALRSYAMLSFRLPQTRYKTRCHQPLLVQRLHSLLVFGWRAGNKC